MKKCGWCLVEKPGTQFYKRTASKDGLAARCKACHNEHVRNWYKANPDLKKEAGKKSYRKHREKRGAYSSRWQKLNPEKRRAKYNKWAAANPDKVAANCAKRRAAKLKACPPWADQKAIAKKYEEAKIMTRTTGIPHQVDHIVPLLGKQVRGLHVDWNLQVIPAAANASKGNRLLEAA